MVSIPSKACVFYIIGITSFGSTFCGGKNYPGKFRKSLNKESRFKFNFTLINRSVHQSILIFGLDRTDSMENMI